MADQGKHFKCSSYSHIARIEAADNKVNQLADFLVELVKNGRRRKPQQALTVASNALARLLAAQGIY